MVIPGAEMCDDELVDLVTEIEDYKKNMQVAEQEMKSSTSAFMAAHATTLEVLGEAGKYSIRRGFIQNCQEMSNACSVQWNFLVQKFRRSTSSIVIGQYLSIP